MELSYYWLISITTEVVSVGLIKRGNPNTLAALGPETEWLPDNPDSFLHSVDISLSEAAQKASLEPEQEPETSAFILPPKWIGNDGKIFPEYLKLLENLCRSLKLKPLGFISNDEAFIESLGKEDSFPPSFILVYLGIKEFSLSLVYLGEVKKRFHQALSNDFTPQDLENALVTVRLDSALPPRILVFGHLGLSIIDDLKNYSWIGKKNVETFLHLPDVEAYQPEELFSLYCKTVSSQIENKAQNASPPPVEKVDISDNNLEEIAEEPIEEIEETEEAPKDEKIFIEEDIENSIDEVPAMDLGFSQITDSDSIVLTPPTSIDTDSFAKENIETQLPPSKSNINLPKFSFPKISLPSLKFNPWFLFPLALSPLLLLIPYYLMKAEITINFTPVEINKDFNVTLDSTATDVTTSTIPVLKKTLDLKFSESIATTGQKETGDKSKGEITLFNKADKIQNAPKGTILSDNSGKKYELLTSIQVPASTFDLAVGSIAMGKINATIIASDIGPEFDLNKDTLLSFKDNANLLAKVNETITGGSRRQIRVVSSEDKSKLNKVVTDSLPTRISEKVDAESSLAGLMTGTLFVDKKQLDFNREIGEEADTLQVNANLVLSLLQVDPQQKENILKTLLVNNQDVLKSISSPADFSFTFNATQNTSLKSTGKLTITGKTLPKIDTESLRSRLVGKSITDALSIVDSQSRVYDRDIKIIPSPFKFLKRLPPSRDKITIIQKF
ncbi:MAG TPA: hypothetical protein VN174_00440 [Candidatus Methanoperedens sp.]|nr:hypothetical protein [Candidatus Methanoperedens sp.]